MTFISTAPSRSGAQATHAAAQTRDLLSGTPSSGEETGSAGGDFASLIGALAGEAGGREKSDDAPETDAPIVDAGMTEAGMTSATLIAASLVVSAAVAPQPSAETQEAKAQGADAAGTVGESPSPPSAGKANASTIVLSADYADAARRALAGTEPDKTGKTVAATPSEAPSPEDATLQKAVTALTVPGSAPRATPHAERGASAHASPQGPAGAPASLGVVAETAGADTARSGDSDTRQGTGDGQESAERRFATGTAAAIGQLSEIVQSLPPIVQTQIGLPVAGITAMVQPANTAQALDAQVIDMGVSGQWIDRMAQEISTLAQGTGESRFTLMPPHLGRIEISLRQSEASTAVHFATETDEAADRIRAAQTNLQADARLSALSIGTITVEKSQQSFDQATRDGGGWAGNARHGADGSTQSQSGGQGTLGRENKASGRRDVNHLSETPEQARREGSAPNPGVRFA